MYRHQYIVYKPITLIEMHIYTETLYTYKVMTPNLFGSRSLKPGWFFQLLMYATSNAHFQMKNTTQYYIESN